MIKHENVRTTEDGLQFASGISHIIGAFPLFLATAIISNSGGGADTPDLEQNVFALLSATAGVEGLGLVLSGVAPLTREPTSLTKREQVDTAGRILLGTGLISIPSLYLFQSVASRKSLASISAFTFLTIAVGSITLGLAQDKGNLMKWNS
jgi:hypothetical protein